MIFQAIIVSRFLLDFTDEFLGNSLDEKLGGRPIYPKKTLLNILVYGEINRISSTEEIVDLVKYHTLLPIRCR
ncbi:MAG: hypothetical protein LBC39_07825 [Methanobrevibacter sp.]|jgi:transposase|nr:hypothetical protein [Candidatus Methanovirga aequatorialis]